MYELEDLFDNIFVKHDTNAIQNLTRICDEQIGKIDELAERFGLTDMVKKAEETNINRE